MNTEAMAALTRLNAAHAQFDRVAAETLAMLADQQRASLARQERITASANECLAAMDAVLSKVRSLAPLDALRAAGAL